MARTLWNEEIPEKINVKGEIQQLKKIQVLGREYELMFICFSIPPCWEQTLDPKLVIQTRSQSERICTRSKRGEYRRMFMGYRVQLKTNNDTVCSKQKYNDEAESPLLACLHKYWSILRASTDLVVQYSGAVQLLISGLAQTKPRVRKQSLQLRVSLCTSLHTHVHVSTVYGASIDTLVCYICKCLDRRTAAVRRTMAYIFVFLCRHIGRFRLDKRLGSSGEKRMKRRV